MGNQNSKGYVIETQTEHKDWTICGSFLSKRMVGSDDIELNVDGVQINNNEMILINNNTSHPDKKGRLYIFNVISKKWKVLVLDSNSDPRPNIYQYDVHHKSDENVLYLISERVSKIDLNGIDNTYNKSISPQIYSGVVSYNAKTFLINNQIHIFGPHSLCGDTSTYSWNYHSIYDLESQTAINNEKSGLRNCFTGRNEWKTVEIVHIKSQNKLLLVNTFDICQYSIQENRANKVPSKIWLSRYQGFHPILTNDEKYVIILCIGQKRDLQNYDLLRYIDYCSVVDLTDMSIKESKIGLIPVYNPSIVMMRNCEINKFLVNGFIRKTSFDIGKIFPTELVPFVEQYYANFGNDWIFVMNKESSFTGKDTHINCWRINVDNILSNLEEP